MSENGDFIIKVKDVSKDYGKFRALESMSFTVPKGSIYGLVGRNGAGKTTIMRIISGLQKPTKGNVEYGFDHKKLGNVGALVELPSIYSNYSARDNLVFQYMNLGLKIDSSIDEKLRPVGLGNTGSKRAGKFSLGMRQRLGIAMAMCGDPEVLILDEPINGLDPQGIIQIRDLLILWETLPGSGYNNETAAFVPGDDLPHFPEMIRVHDAGSAEFCHDRTHVFSLLSKSLHGQCIELIRNDYKRFRERKQRRIRVPVHQRKL